jgi:hypothetical protein
LFEGPFPVAVINGVSHILSDLSESGLAAFAPSSAAAALSTGTEIRVSLQLGETVLHSGEADVARIEETSLGRKLGLRFKRSHIDLTHVLERYRQELMRARLRNGLMAPGLSAPPAFRVLCADLLSALRTCRDVLDEERHGKLADPDALIGECLEGLQPILASAALEANRTLESVLEDTGALAALKRTATQILTPDVAASPLWSRAADKPLGYPGDFHLIRALHEPAPQSGPA